MTDRTRLEAVEIEVYGIEVTSGRYLGSYDIRAEPYDADRRFAVIDADVTIDGRPAGSEAVAAWLARTHRPRATVVIDWDRYGHVTSVSFNTEPASSEPTPD